MDFDFDLVGGTRVASELYGLRLAEQSDEFLVSTLTIGLEVLLKQPRYSSILSHKRVAHERR
jgi:hypothetical protein